jgi:hypothetical protein
VVTLTVYFWAAVWLFVKGFASCGGLLLLKGADEVVAACARALRGGVVAQQI